MITQAPVTLEGGRHPLFALWWTPLTTSASVLEPHPSHQVRGHAGASHMHATTCTTTGTSDRLRKSIATLLITFLQTLLFRQLVQGMSFTVLKQAQKFHKPSEKRVGVSPLPPTSTPAPKRQGGTEPSNLEQDAWQQIGPGRNNACLSR